MSLKSYNFCVKYLFSSHAFNIFRCFHESYLTLFRARFIFKQKKSRKRYKYAEAEYDVEIGNREFKLYRIR